MNVSERIRHRLELRAQELEELFARNGLQAQVEGGALQPDGVSYQIQLAQPLAAALQRQLRAELVETFPGCAPSLSADGAVLRVTLDSARELQLYAILEAQPALAPRTAVLGYTDTGTPLLLDFGDASLEHVVFIGAEGAGKTAALRTCAVSLALSSRQSQIQMLFIDPHCDRPETPSGPGLHALHYLPHALAAVVADIEDVEDVLGYLEEEAAYRRSHAVRLPTIAVFIDNVDVLLDEGSTAQKKALQLLLARGAESGIHCVMTARPSSSASRSKLSELLALKPVLRITGRVESAKQAYASTLIAQTGAENLLGKGDFLIAREEQPIRFQTAFVDAYDLHWCLESLQRRRPPAILARPAAARPIYAAATSASIHPQPFSFDGRQISLEQDVESSFPP